MTTLNLSDSTRLVAAPTGDLPSIVSEADSLTTSTVGCVDGNQTPTYIVPAGSVGVLNWTIRDQSGNPVQLSDVDTPPDVDLSHDYDRMVLFHNPFCDHKVYRGRIAVADGQLKLFPPPAIANKPGIYQVEVHWRDGLAGDAAERQYLNSGFMSIEQTLAQRAAGSGCAVGGPLQLSRVRTRLRDFVSANDVTGTQEYSVEELLTAILEPIECYNETLPTINSYTPNNFPYRQQWLDATVARLLLLTGTWMQRNSVPVAGDGVGADDRAKYRDILAIGKNMWDEYRLFCRQEKVSKNIAGAFRII